MAAAPAVREAPGDLTVHPHLKAPGALADWEARAPLGAALVIRVVRACGRQGAPLAFQVRAEPGAGAPDLTAGLRLVTHVLS